MKTEERTFVAIKPDGVKRGFIGKIKVLKLSQ